MDNTSIRINKETRDNLKKLKIHPNQSCSEVIDKLISVSGANVIKINQKEDKIKEVKEKK